MKILITFNFVMGVLFAATTVAGAKWEFIFLLGIFPFLGFGLLALLNLASITEQQRLQIEWLHIGIMNFVYGNLLEKRRYPFQKKLGDNWYFNRS